MAIALDVSATSTSQTSSPITWSHTCTGSNLLLTVGITLQAVTSFPTASAVTYNGVSMTKARADTFDAGAFGKLESSVWLLHAPATGSNTVSVTFTGGTSPSGVGSSTSYTGAQQSDTADASNGTTGNTTGDKTFTVTTVSDNCWIYVVGMNAATTTPTLAADQTSRGTVSWTGAVADIVRAEDTNAAQTPAGAKTVGLTVGASFGEKGYVITGASFAPLAVASTVKQLSALGVG